MNKRIRELWDKAAESTAAYPSGQNNSWETQVNFMDKFAELIVLECVDLLETNGNKQFTIRTIEPESHTKTTDWMEGYEEAVKHYGSFLLKKNAKLIKKHFGVEE